MARITPRRQYVLVGLAVAVYLLLSRFWQDIAFYDESYYLAGGSKLHISDFYSAYTTAPLYSLWYKVLSFVCKDAIGRYFLSWGVLCAICSLTPLIFGVKRAWFFALLALALPLYAEPPYVSLFASTIILLGLSVLLTRARSLLHAIEIALAVSFALAFCRPEYAYGVFASAALLLLFAVVSRTANARSKSIAVAMSLGLAAVMLLVIHCSPATRSGEAFAQHANIRMADRGILGHQDPWISAYANQAFHVDTTHNAANTVATIGDFLRGNPKLFLRLVYYNLRDRRTIALVGGIAAALLVCWKMRAKSNLPGAGLFLILVSFPVIASCALIYPERHYFAILAPSLILLLLQAPTDRLLPTNTAMKMAAAAACIVVMFSIALSKQRLLSRNHQQALAAVDCIRRVDKSVGRVNPASFDPLGLPDIYLPRAHQQVALYDLRSIADFKGWVENARPGEVVVIPAVAQYYAVSAPQLDEFLRANQYSAYICPERPTMVVYSATQTIPAE